MSGERLAQLAVKSTIDYLDSSLQTYLTAVETARGMTAGDLTPPVDVIGADLPEYGGGTPYIEVFENTGKEERQAGAANRLWVFDLSVILTHACDAGIETGRQFVRDYVTAMTDLFQSSGGQTLGSKVGRVLITDVSYALNHGSAAKHLIHAALGLEVHLFDS